jgi:anti-sigma regulatory factor (Ser/Thr protein kinase)
MAASSESADQTASAPETAAASASGLRWRQVFPGDERQLGELRRWLAGLLPACAARNDVVSVAVELATNAVKFSASGRGGWFVVEITWYRQTVRVAVADGGGPTAPHMIEEPMGDHGRGLVMVRALSARIGACGDHRGRLVWAEVPWMGDGAVALWSSPYDYEAAIRQDEAALLQRFAGVAIWFGRCTLQWWALPSPVRGNRLLTAPSARELAELLDRARPSPGPRRSVTQDPGVARAGEPAHVPVAPVPPRIHRGRSRAPRLGAQPC